MPAVLIGDKEILLKLKRLATEAPVAAGFGAYEGAQAIMKDAKVRAPKDTHQMALSGYVTAPTIKSSGRVEIESGFGGPSEEYVARIHEDMSMSHPNGEAKFFQNAIDAFGHLIPEAIARHVRIFLETGRTNPVSKDVPQTPWESGFAGGLDEMKSGKVE